MLRTWRLGICAQSKTQRFLFASTPMHSPMQTGVCERECQCQAYSAGKCPISLATIVAFVINLGYTPGYRRGATGTAPSAHAGRGGENAVTEAGGGSESTATVAGYMIRPP